MKKAVLSLLFFFITFLSNAQEQKFVKPDYNQIEKAIINSSSNLYYPKLMDRFTKGDSTMTIEEKTHLYYGYTFQDAYSPYGSAKDQDKLFEILRKQNYSDDDYSKIVQYCDNILKEYPFDLRILNYQIYALEKTGPEERVKIKVTQLKAIIDAILSTGKGVEKSDPIYVISVSHEYDILDILGFKYGGSQSLIDRCDYLTLAENEYKIAGLYFDVSASLNSMMKALKGSSKFKKSELIGTWKIVEVNDGMATDENMKKFNESMKGVTLTFNKNGTLEYKSDDSSKIGQEFLKMLDNSNWKYNEENKEIRIGNKKDNYSVMIFKIETDADTTYFEIEDNATLMKLKVEKIN